MSVVPLREVLTVAQDPVAALRRLADNIEAGEYGVVDGIEVIGVAVLGDEGVDVLGFGRLGMSGNVALVFQNAIAQLASRLDG